MKLLAVVFLILFTTACTQKSLDEKILQTKQSIESGQYNSSIIELKNVITEAPDNPEARYLLAKAYVNIGMPHLAEKEITKAIELGYQANDINTLLLQSLTQQEDNNAIIEFYNYNQSLLSPQEKVLIALAFFKKTQKNEAAKLLKSIDNASKQEEYLVQGMIAITNQQYREAIKLIAPALQEQKTFLPEFIIELAKLYTMVGQSDLAAEQFQRYYQYRPNLHFVQLYIASTLINSGKEEQAIPYVDKILSLIATQPFANYLKSTIELKSGNYKAALNHAEKAISYGYDVPNSRLNAGISSYYLKQYEISRNHLAKFQGEFPEGHIGKKIYYSALLQLGYTDEVNTELLNIATPSLDDNKLIISTGYQLMKEGEIEKAKNLIKHSEGMNIEDPNMLTQQGMLKIAMNDPSGIDNLEKALIISKDDFHLELILNYSYFKTGEVTKAKNGMEEWIKDHSDDVNGLNLLAAIYQKLGDIPNFEKTLTNALNIKPGNPPSLMYYANKAAQNGKIEQAIDTLSELIKLSPNYLPAYVKGFELTKSTQLQQKWLKLENQSLAENTDFVLLRHELIRQYMQSSQPSIALELLNYFQNGQRLSDKYWMQLTRSLLLNNQNEEALKKVQQWIDIAPAQKAPKLQKIILLEKLGKYDEALKEIQQAKKTFNNYSEFHVAEIPLLLKTKNISQAELEFNKLSNKIQNSLYGKGMLGKIYFAKKQFKDALPLLNDYYQALPNTENTLEVFSAKMVVENKTTALSFMEQHLKTNPSDVFSRTVLAGTYATFNSDLAIEQYENILQQDENSIVALNNLAWLYAEKNELKLAEKYITDALNKHKKSVQLFDTYGVILDKAHRYDDAAQQFEKAMQLKPSNDIIFHYAELLMRMKQTTKAKNLLSNVPQTSKEISTKISTILNMNN